MNVFKPAITLFVMFVVVLASQPAHALWAYHVVQPHPPQLITTKFLNNPTVAQIQQAISPRTRVYISGTVNASTGGRIHIEHNDVQLNFFSANVVNWTGGDTWEGFINIYSSRVQVLGLRLTVHAGPGRCRGVVIGNASDVRIAGCVFKNTADGLVGDGHWARLLIMNTHFLNCSNWVDESMPGGYGIFLEDHDAQRDDLQLINLTITLAANSGQHGVRISQAQHVMIDNCQIGANEKRSFWAYGVDCMAIRRTTFKDGSVLFNLMAHEYYTNRPTTRVRIDSCRIEHTGILQPISIYCGRGSRCIQIRDLDVTSTSSPYWMSIGWRTETPSWFLQWHSGKITFNGQQMNGNQGVHIIDWNAQERNSKFIGPMS